ncbi:CDP-alcohol phosphatidyltransferase family protein [Nonomuraea soli]|uniref:Phosphatidylglycerophosphate synthase n=1 Tax=Nonomuraea soli TaxID=1032476 RepID=A0A7W0CK29_9ACTN|nr:CDP-alcohol phosphatidyltransferase family protein [Nonomuraea soli]MBA2892605.1 phosphatidylglycerophosphate synthase [Nonomuraea soli]
MPEQMTRESTTTAAVVLATTPACRLACADGTLVDRLSGQLGELPVREVHIVPSGGGLADDLRAVAQLARLTHGPVVVLPADIVAHTESLALLLEHPSHDTAALVSPDRPPGPLHPPVRLQGGRVAAAGSSFHTVPEANATFLSVLQVGEADLGCLADISDELADLVAAGRLGPVTAIEATDLLLVGLVRSGVGVRAAQIGPLHCGRVTGQSGVDSAVTRLADVDEARVRLDTAVKTDDGFFATHFVSSWSKPLVRLAARLKLKPNSVTGISIGLAVLAAVWFTYGARWAQVLGGVLFYLSFVLDCVDGQLARYTREFTPLGAWADAMADRFKEYLVYAGLAIGYAAGLGNPDGIWYLAVGAMILQVTRHTVDFSFAGAVSDAARVGAAWARPPRSLMEPADQGPHGIRARLERDTLTRWLKKMIVLPIGERTALIAITAAVFNARVTFLSLLGWGAVALLYQLIGRIERAST